jgi:hypothetical protein
MRILSNAGRFARHELASHRPVEAEVGRHAPRRTAPPRGGQGLRGRAGC